MSSKSTYSPLPVTLLTGTCTHHFTNAYIRLTHTPPSLAPLIHIVPLGSHLPIRNNTLVPLGHNPHNAVPSQHAFLTSSGQLMACSHIHTHYLIAQFLRTDSWPQGKSLIGVSNAEHCTDLLFYLGINLFVLVRDGLLTHASHHEMTSGSRDKHASHWNISKLSHWGISPWP